MPDVHIRKPLLPITCRFHLQVGVVDTADKATVSEVQHQYPASPQRSSPPTNWLKMASHLDRVNVQCKQYRNSRCTKPALISKSSHGTYIIPLPHHLSIPSSGSRSKEALQSFRTLVFGRGKPECLICRNPQGYVGFARPAHGPGVPSAALAAATRLPKAPGVPKPTVVAAIHAASFLHLANQTHQGLDASNKQNGYSWPSSKADTKPMTRLLP